MDTGPTMGYMQIGQFNSTLSDRRMFSSNYQQTYFSGALWSSLEPEPTPFFLWPVSGLGYGPGGDRAED